MNTKVLTTLEYTKRAIARIANGCNDFESAQHGESCYCKFGSELILRIFYLRSPI